MKIDSFHYPKNSDVKFHFRIHKSTLPKGPSLKERVEDKIEEIIKMLKKAFKRMSHTFPALTQKQINLIDQVKKSYVRPVTKATVLRLLLFNLNLSLPMQRISLILMNLFSIDSAALRTISRLS